MELFQRGYPIPIKLYPIRLLQVGGLNFHHISPDPESPPFQNRIVPFILESHQSAPDFGGIQSRSSIDADPHVPVHLGTAQPIDAGNGSHHDHIPPLAQGSSGCQAEPVDLVVDGGILLDIEVLGGDIRFRLIVVVVGNKVLHRILGEELFELPIQLGGESLVVADYQGGKLDLLYDLGHGEGLPGTGYTL